MSKRIMSVKSTLMFKLSKLNIASAEGNKYVLENIECKSIFIQPYIIIFTFIRQDIYTAYLRYVKLQSKNSTFYLSSALITVSQ